MNNWHINDENQRRKDLIAKMDFYLEKILFDYDFISKFFFSLLGFNYLLSLFGLGLLLLGVGLLSFQVLF